MDVTICGPGDPASGTFGGAIGVIDVQDADFAFGCDENDFEMTVPPTQVPGMYALVYVPGTDIIGMVTGIETTSGQPAVKVSGQTWTGILSNALLIPQRLEWQDVPSGDYGHWKIRGMDYITLPDSDVSVMVRRLIDGQSLEDDVTYPAELQPRATDDYGWGFSWEKSPLSCFTCDETNVCGTGGEHTFKGRRGGDSQSDDTRFMTVWDAIWQVLADYGCSITARTHDGDGEGSGKIALTVSRAATYDIAEPAMNVSVTVKRAAPVTDIACLGNGEGSERLIYRSRLEKDGPVEDYWSAIADEGFLLRYKSVGKDIASFKRDRNYLGYETRWQTYSVQSDNDEKVSSEGVSRLKELNAETQSVSISTSTDKNLNLGDIIGGVDQATGIEAYAVVSKKVVKVSGGRMSYEYTTSMRG